MAILPKVKLRPPVLLAAVSETFTGETDVFGQASINPSRDGIVYLQDECTSQVEGDDETYDVDDGEASKGAWKGKSMKSLPGLGVINPFTDIAVTLSEVEGNESLSNDQLKSKVLDMLGYDDTDKAADVLFEDFGENAGDSEDNAEVALVAQGVFDAKVQVKEALEKAGGNNDNATNLVNLLTTKLPQVKEKVEKAVTDAKAVSQKVQDIKVTIDLDLPDPKAGDDFDLDEFLDDIKNISIVVTIDKKPTDDPATGTGTGTGTNGVNQG